MNTNIKVARDLFEHLLLNNEARMPADQGGHLHLTGTEVSLFRSVLTANEEDWAEDFHHENGNYVCRCVHCSKSFVGYKQRNVCKICATRMTQESLSQALSV